jgi:hypothetical protein
MIGFLARPQTVSVVERRCGLAIAQESSLKPAVLFDRSHPDRFHLPAAINRDQTKGHRPDRSLVLLSVDVDGSEQPPNLQLLLLLSVRLQVKLFWLLFAHHGELY